MSKGHDPHAKQIWTVRLTDRQKDKVNGISEYPPLAFASRDITSKSKEILMPGTIDYNHHKQ